MDFRNKRSLLFFGSIWLMFGYMCFRLVAIELGGSISHLSGLSESSESSARSLQSDDILTAKVKKCKTKKSKNDSKVVSVDWIAESLKQKPQIKESGGASKSNNTKTLVPPDSVKSVPSESSSQVFPGFQKVDYAQDLWIYSVFYEYVNPASNSPGIRAIGLSNVDKKYVDNTVKPIFNLQFADGKTMEVVGREEKPFFDGRWSGLWVVYANIVLECDLPYGIQPKYVSFSWPKNSTLSSRFEVTYPNLSKPKRNMTMCYPVVWGNFNNYDEIIQNLEYNRLIGVDHFYIYKQKVGTEVEALFQFYIKQGILTVLPMPVHKVVKGSWYYGQQVSIMDCHTRNRYLTEYVIVHDTDEYIVPKQHSSFADMMDFLKKNHTESWNKFISELPNDDIRKRRAQFAVDKGYAAFSFQNTFFSRHPANGTELKDIQDALEITDEDFNVIRKTQIKMLLEMRHGGYWNFPRRQKTIFRPDLVILPGTHWARKRTSNTVDIRVNNSVAILAHHKWKGSDFWSKVDFHPQPFYRKYLDKVKGAREDFLSFNRTQEVVLKNTFKYYSQIQTL